MSVSVTNLQIAVRIEGADEAAGKLKKVEDAAESAGKKAKDAGGLFAGFESGIKKLDDAVDAVEKPMRTFNGALDLVSVALGVGMAGPLGQVIEQFIDLAGSVVDAIGKSELFVDSSTMLSNSLAEVGNAAKVTRNEIDDLIQTVGLYNLTVEQGIEARARRGQLVGVQEQMDAADQRIASAEAVRDEANRRAQLAELDLANFVAGDTVRGAQREQMIREKTERVQQLREAELEAEQEVQAEVARSIELSKEKKGLIDDQTRSLGLLTAEEKKAEQDREKARQAQEKADEASRKAAREQTELEKKRADEAKKRAEIEEKRAKDELEATFKLMEVQAAAMERARLIDEEKAKAAERAAKVASGELSISDAAPIAVTDNPLLSALLEEGTAELDKTAEPAGALAQSLKSLGDSAADLGSFGVQAMQSFSQAAGQALASLVIDGEKATGSFKKLAGQVAAGLSAQAFGYAVFLTALGTAAALVPGLQLEAPKIFTGAAVMAGTGLLLGITARALGASTYGPGSAGQSASSAGGAQDRVSSFSAGGGGAQPMQVTVVLGVDEVSNVLVRQSQREARSGSLSTSRLAVA